MPRRGEKARLGEEYHVLPTTIERVTVLGDGDWPVVKGTAARLLAIGCTLEDTAKRCDVVIKTLSNWKNDPAFDAYVTQIRQTLASQIEPSIMANVALALELQRRVFAGELKANEPRYVEAARLISRVLDRLFYVAPPLDPTGDAPRGVHVAINNRGG
jgi:hypothetical protein